MRQLLFVIIAAVVACTPDAPVAVTTTPPPVAISADDSLAALRRPAFFVGELPCADCEGITTSLVLLPDGSYLAQDQYRGSRVEGTGAFFEVGRWILDNEMIILGGVQGTNRRFAPNAEQTLTLRSGDGSAIPSGISQTLYRVPERPAFVGQLRGLAEFRYLADAASITECHSGVQLPVAGDSAFLELERVYAASGVAGGEPLLVRVAARIEQRPAMEGDAQVETVVVDSVAAAEDDVPCGTIALKAALSEGPWSLVQLDGAEVPAAVTGGEVPTIEWRAEGPTVGGSAGCNRYTGRGTLRGAYLVPAPLAMTRRMCVEESAMQREARFGTLISEGGWFAIINDTLRFAQGPYVKARFVRR